MTEFNKWDKLYINRIRTKNSRLWSNYLFMCDRNKDKDKALITFTSPQKEANEKLSDIKEIKKHFSKLLSNLKIDLDKFVVIELGQNKNNPHVHIQLFYHAKDLDKIYKAYTKTLIKFQLFPELCAFTQTDKSKTHIKYFSYILKEYSQKLSDNELMDLDTARSSLRVGENRNMQFISHSHNLLTRATYKHLYYKYQIGYSKADFFYLAKFLHITKSKNKRHFKISWTLRPILELLLYLFLPSENSQIRQKFQYINKYDKVTKFKPIYTNLTNTYGFT